MIVATLTLLTFSGPVIDLKQQPFEEEVHLVAIDVAVNPTNMPDAMLWDKPILLVYTRVDSFEGLRADVVREEIVNRFDAGTYRPVVIRARQKRSLTLHFSNLIGIGNAPVRTVQGRVCKACKAGYTFSYGPGSDVSMYPWSASIHAHGVTYTIDNDGTDIGTNTANDPANQGLVPPGEERTYVYERLDLPGVWPLHDHALPAHTVSRGLHMALVVTSRSEPIVDHDFLILFSDYPDFEAYEDEFYGDTGVPPFLHMKNAFVMHAHAFNGYADMLAPRMMRSQAMGGTRFQAMRTDTLGAPRTPVYEVALGSLIRFRFLSMGSSGTTHSFHLHGHAWREGSGYADSIDVPTGGSREIMFYAGGGPYRGVRDRERDRIRSGPGDWLFHCHVIPHVKHGMWGIFRVLD